MTQTITPRTDTGQVYDSKPIDREIGRRTRHGRTLGAAIAATVLAATTGLLAYRAIVGSSEQAVPADTSHDTAEHQRHLSLKPAANVNSSIDSFDAAEYARMQRLAGEDSFDAAEYARMQRLADNSARRP
jgi:hypothetical protein